LSLIPNLNLVLSYNLEITNIQGPNQIPSASPHSNQTTITATKPCQTCGILIGDATSKIQENKIQKKTTHTKTTNAQQVIPIDQTLFHTKQHCLFNYGFMASPQLSLQQNFNVAIWGITKYNKHQPANATFHNLCTTNEIPLGTKQLLG
jgi:hypothetical protein